MPTPMEVALSAARSAGEILERFFGDDVAMRSKSIAADLVSDVDIQAEQQVVSEILGEFPDHRILGEEGGIRGGHSPDHLWVIDPLDGTTNFAHQIPHFAVSIGYYVSGVAQSAVVWNPIRRDLYTAERGCGAFHNGRSIRVSSQRQLTDVLIGVGFHFDGGMKLQATLAAVADCIREQTHGIRRMGAASLDLCLVATGAFGGFFEYQLSPWDFAAGALIVEEAGGQISNCSGQSLALTTSGVLAANGALHAALLAIVSRHLHPEVAGPAAAS